MLSVELVVSEPDRSARAFTRPTSDLAPDNAPAPPNIGLLPPLAAAPDAGNWLAAEVELFPPKFNPAPHDFVAATDSLTFVDEVELSPSVLFLSLIHISEPTRPY